MTRRNADGGGQEPADQPSLLLVEDDAKLSGLLVQLFTGEGYDVDLAQDGHTGSHRALIHECWISRVSSGLAAATPG
ncbi:response regulator transcription factor [Phytoactinopolyspora endophytica]|uniref:response regulator transcription factor n=1 Tax=Phytoactinopolyspora endophytica TaxID=1642495 RepID=UPI00101C1589|nr:response regulator transcription factor [Phytoactinopolyspora endophytica]